MTHMLCRNRVKDFATWKRIFASHVAAHRGAGLKLVHLWRGLEDPNNVFFLFEVGTVEKAREFMNAPDAATIRKEAGVIDGEMHFLESSEHY